MKILFVVEKPSSKKIFEDIIKKYPNDKVSINLTCINPTFHIDDYYLRFRVNKFNEICENTVIKKDAKWLKLNKINIPTGTFFEINNDFQKINTNDYDFIIGCPDSDINGILGFEKFIEKNKVQNAKFIKLLDLSEKNIFSAIKLENVLDFSEILKDCIETLKQNNFSSIYPRKNDVKKLREKTHWNRATFAKYFNISYRTVENWENLTSDCSQYLYDLMEYKLEKEGLIKK